jgi:ribosome assembly protein RRB1
MSLEPDMEVDGEDAPGAGGAGGEAPENEMQGDGETTDDDAESSDQEDESGDEEECGVYIPGDELEQGQTLEVDENAYILYQQCSLGPPCLSFDILEDQVKSDFPLSVTCVAGTQAAKVTANNIILFRMSNLNCVRPRAEDEEDDDADDVPDSEKPVLKMAGIKHSGCVNRIKYNLIGPTPVAAAWAENGTVAVWNLSTAIARLDQHLISKEVYREEAPPLQAFTGHSTEGFALDWSKTEPGVLASGDCAKNIHVWRPAEGGHWNISDQPYVSHTQSVEDIRWSPNEKNVMASCSVDKSIKVWDVRAPQGKACMLTKDNAHLSDINVIDWNKSEPFILSGGDDGVVKVWDLRSFGGAAEPVASFSHHTGAVTGVEWHQEDSTVFASSGADDQIALWDLALERDAEGMVEENKKLSDLPPQLLFIHQGLKDIKELHWHSKVPGLIVATSHTGFDVFKTISV